MPQGVSSAVAIVVLVAVAAGCTREPQTPWPAECSAPPREITDALRSAPGAVTLGGQTRLSDCVRYARADADMQTIGSSYTSVADDLARRAAASSQAALQLGYLIGATRRGARHTTGIHLELVRRLEQTTGIEGPGPARRAAFDRGLAAGSLRG